VKWILHKRGWSGKETDYRVKYELLPQGVKVERADFRRAVFADVNLGDIRLRRANLAEANLVRAKLQDAELTDADLSSTDLGFADFTDATLSWVNLSQAHVREVLLRNAHLRFSDLSGTRFSRSDLSGANLRGAHLSVTTFLGEVTLNDQTQLRDVVWNGASLTQIDWARVQRLGDELEAKRKTSHDKTAKTKHQQLEDFRGAVRAYKQLALALQAQGLTDEAGRFGYRTQVLKRGLHWRQNRFGRWCFSWLLAILAGYGYRLWRIFAAYVLVVGLFTVAFLASGVLSSHAAPTAPQVFDALQISLNAIHGRVFFAQFHLDTIQSWLATAGAAYIGIDRTTAGRCEDRNPRHAEQSQSSGEPVSEVAERSMPLVVSVRTLDGPLPPPHGRRWTAADYALRDAALAHTGVRLPLRSRLQPQGQ
jgi:hypothetical protein